jgi:sulfocyanin
MYSSIEKTREVAKRRSGRGLLTVVVAAGLAIVPFLQASAASGRHSHAPQNGQSPSWMTVDAGSQTVEFKIVAAQTNANSSLNFNGYAKGDMTLVVPVGWHVKIDFSNNDSSVPHSLVVMAVQKSLPIEVNEKQAAFDGASTNSPVSGIVAGKTLNFEFTANKAGKYWLICGVPGHAVQGMWDYLEVSSSANSPHVSIASGS